MTEATFTEHVFIPTWRKSATPIKVYEGMSLAETPWDDSRWCVLIDGTILVGDANFVLHEDIKCIARTMRPECLVLGCWIRGRGFPIIQPLAASTDGCARVLLSRLTTWHAFSGSTEEPRTICEVADDYDSPARPARTITGRVCDE